MVLFINTNTTNNDAVEIVLKRRDGSVLASKKFKARFKQTEKLLPAIEKLLKVKKLRLSDIKKIEVANSGGSFTSLRIGVVTANALAYALKIPVAANHGTSEIVRSGRRSFKIVEPIYGREPEITVKKIKCG